MIICKCKLTDIISVPGKNVLVSQFPPLPLSIHLSTPKRIFFKVVKPSATHFAEMALNILFLSLGEKEGYATENYAHLIFKHEPCDCARV